MPRQGLGASFGYSKNGTRHVFRLRCGGYNWGIQQIADESQARTKRAFYPHLVAPTPFSVIVLLNGYAEYQTFMRWMAGYMEYLLDEENERSTPPVMTVAIPGRGFLRQGVPTQGIEFGDHVGSMLWQVPITFESVNDPMERNQHVNHSVFSTALAFHGANAESDVRYFYPFSDQLSGDQVPVEYDAIVTDDDVVQEALASTENRYARQVREY